MDRHAFKDPNKPAIIYEADEQEGGRTITYGELMARQARSGVVAVEPSSVRPS